MDMRQIINLVEAAHSPLENPAFIAWFAGSKVVDGVGDPLVVYHGTSRSFGEFARFTTTTPYLWDDNGLGFFFTPDPGRKSDAGNWGGANGYAGVRQVDGETVVRTGANLRPCFLSIKCPYVFEFKEYIGSITRAGSGEKLQEQLNALGYDGVFRQAPCRKEIAHYIAFEADQIKSIFEV